MDTNLQYVFVGVGSSGLFVVIYIYNVKVAHYFFFFFFEAVQVAYLIYSVTALKTAKLQFLILNSLNIATLNF